MGKAHSYAYAAAPQIRSLPSRPRVRAISGRHRDAVERAARDFGAERFTTDWRELVEAPDVEIVDICTPPQARTQRSIEGGGARAPGQGDACARSSWWTRGGSARSGCGAGAGCRTSSSTPRSRSTGGSNEASGRARSRTSGRTCSTSPAGSSARSTRSARSRGRSLQHAPGPTERCERSTSTDASSALLRFRSGALGVFEVAKTCVRRPCDFTVEVNGERGTLRFDYARLNELWYGDGGEEPEL